MKTVVETLLYNSTSEEGFCTPSSVLGTQILTVKDVTGRAQDCGKHTYSLSFQDSNEKIDTIFASVGLQELTSLAYHMKKAKGNS